MRKSVLWTLVCMAVMTMIFSMGPVTAEAGTMQTWTLVYKHDANGNAISGSLSDLMTAVQNGADVRVIEHQATLDISRDVDKVVADFTVNRVTGVYFGVVGDGAGSLIHKRIYFRTTGVMDVFYESNPTHSDYSTTSAMSWYIQE